MIYKALLADAPRDDTPDLAAAS
ncbi:hypothetical protein FRAHR75_1720003 [Frankia sp. Hr75.2]|nr:hypothetical protein FRAHR75_1720003 [Frankia sp. Hr75.2]